MNSFFDISKVGSIFFLSRSILFLLISKPITSRFFPNSTASGNPTYPIHYNFFSYHFYNKFLENIMQQKFNLKFYC